MVDPPDFDDPGPLPIREPSRIRRVASVTIVLLLVASMVFLAWVSGRGEVTVKPVEGPTPVASAPIAHRLAVVDGAGRLTTMDADGGSVATYGQAGVSYRFPAWSPDGSRIAAVATTATGNAVHVFAVPKPGVSGSSSAVPTTTDPTSVYEAAQGGPFYVYWAPNSTTLTFLSTEPDGIALRMGSADGTQPVHIVRQAMPLYWAWSDKDRMLVHTGGDGPGAFLGEVSLDGTTTADLGVRPGDFRAPARSGDGRFRGYIVPATDTPEHVVVEGSDGSARHEVPVLGGGVVGFGPDGDELAFIAPAKGWPAGHGPDRATPRSRRRFGRGADPAAGQRRGLLLVAQRPDHRRVPDRGTRRHGRAGAQHPTGRRGAGSRPRPDLRRRGFGLGPVANARQTGRYVHHAGPSLLRPVRAQPPSLGAGLERDRPAARRR
jgi:hypothetical protein